MTKKQIRKLVKASYNKNSLDVKLVNRIVKKLNRTELKTYIKLIKLKEQAKTVTLIASKLTDKESLKKEMGKLFPEKSILFKEDASLIGGIKIIDNDLIYEANIKNSLENLTTFINR